MIEVTFRSFKPAFMSHDFSDEVSMVSQSVCDYTVALDRLTVAALTGQKFPVTGLPTSKHNALVMITSIETAHLAIDYRNGVETASMASIVFNVVVN